MAELRAQGPALVVDAGGSLSRASVRPNEDPDAMRAKARVMAEGMVLGGLDAAAVGQGEWKLLGRDGLLGLVEETGYPALAANLSCDGERPLPGHQLLEVGGRKVVVVGLTAGQVEGCVVSDPLEAARAELALVPEADLRVVLLPVRGRDAQAWNDAVVEADLVVDGASGKRRQAAEALGGLAVVSAGSRGKYLGATHIDWVPGGEGFQIVGRSTLLVSEIGRLEKRLEAAVKRVEGATDEARQSRYERQVERYTEQLAEKRAELEAAQGEPDAGRHRIESQLVSLDKTVADHAPSVGLVDRYKAQWPEAESEQTQGKVDRVVPTVP